MSELSSRRILILYGGGESGNSEDLAKRVVWEAKRRHFNVLAFPFDDYQIGRLVKEELVLYICSTAGQGEEPKTMKKFWRFIMRKDLPSDALSANSAAVIGLGDSSYLKYNVVAIKLFKRLKSLGAKMLFDVCLGDDQHDLGFHAAVDPFLSNLWQKLSQIYPLPKDLQIIDENTLPNPTYTLLPKDSEYRQPQPVENPYVLKTYDIYSPYLSTVISNQRVTPEDHFQDVRHVQLEISDEFCMKYSPGDVVSIIPENSDEDVKDFFDLVELKPEETFIIKKIDETVTYNQLYDTIPTPCTILELVKKYLGIHSLPKRSFFELLWKFSTDEIEKQKLKEFTTTDGQKELYDYCIRPRRTILEVLADFHHTAKSIPFIYLFDLIPAIAPRLFSIASSLRQHPRQIHILVAVVNFRTKLKKRRLGLCSNYIAKLQENETVRLWITKGSLTLPADSNTPIIMIATGTGIAPFRSIIQDRVSRNIAPNFLFFGCRYRTKDFFFEEEWNESHARGLLFFYAAFSRENVDKKVYVTEKLLEQRQIVWQLINNCDAHIMIAGNATRMPQDVRQTLTKIMESEGGQEMQGGRAELVISKFEAKGKLQYDCWT
ncbi:NADPH-dependent diflavin oxidoreductase 1-like protein [Dinothrombium tinctorium]|uniref:NADPH-dependent diflavin oxidoreductase 1 n=1 Tax=Dinothrombium tinctorium TaxID=1965070 RepID=A0A3S3PCK3_9ACAR|nr:NADPH-dependent diflavin oxidoreductase 1-like protein [Dinothrombium tinctorium]RWS12649.1 NADPH-dependent diflavin oxidoreductase 1-like protein [Dinothrombium tinctorium]